MERSTTAGRSAMMKNNVASLGVLKSLKLAFRFALREMRGGLSGFYIFIACIALGVGAISGVNSVSLAISDGMKNEGQSILGGDVSLSILYRDFSKDEKAALGQYGELSEVTTLRSMARLPDDSDQLLSEIKAFDEAYPLFGDLRLSSKKPLNQGEIAVDPILLERLNLKINDELRLGAEILKIAAVIEHEPDRVSQGIGFGPKILMDKQTLDNTQLLQPGALNTHHLKVKLFNPAQDVKALIDELKVKFPNADWRIRSRDNAAPSLSRNLTRFSQFLTLVGLAALIIGGVGVANAVGAYLSKKQMVIASFKCLGASNFVIFWLYLFQIMILAGIGILIGVLIGLIIPWLAALGLSNVIPIKDNLAFYPAALGIGALYGGLVALIFAIWVLARAETIPATQLMRSARGSLSGLPNWRYLFIVGLLAIVLMALILTFTTQPYIAGVFMAAILFAFIILRLVALFIQWAFRHAPRSRFTLLRMAIGNIHRPGSLTPSIVLSLGLGLALLVALSLIDGNLRNQVSGNLSNEAPDFFFVDVQNTQLEDFKTLLLDHNRNEDEVLVESVPMLRGRITKLKGIDASDYKAADGGEWVLRGDRGITYSQNLPENSTLSAGKWWPEDYSGEPLVSFSAEEAGELGLTLGDPIEINVLGRNISAKISSLREVEWQSLGINFVMVFSPNTFAGAPHSHIATLKTKAKAGDGALLQKITENFPNVTSVRVRDALNIVNQLIGQIATAIRASASVALIASILVLAGALAAGHDTRTYDGVVMKMLGATRPQLIKSFILEFFILGAVTGVFALFAGGLISWFVISQIMGFTAVFFWDVALSTLGIAVCLSIGFGLLGSWRVLGQKPARQLRETA